MIYMQNRVEHEILVHLTTFFYCYDSEMAIGKSTNSFYNQRQYKIYNSMSSETLVEQEYIL